MASAPSFIQEASTAIDGVGTSKDSPSFDTYDQELLVAYGLAPDATTIIDISNSGTALTWTLRQDVSFTNFGRIRLWTATVPENRPGLVVTFTRSGAITIYGGSVWTFRGSDGVGVSGQAHGTGAPSLGITPSGDNSALVVVNIDWNAVDASARVWRSTAGTFLEVLYYAATFEVYTSGYHPDAGAAAAQTVGMSAPAGQKYSLVGLEVLSGTPRDIVPGDLKWKKGR